MQIATFAAGCFWGIEYKLEKLDGVISTRVGYAGGHKHNPTYEEVCSNSTGHAEAVELTFDPEKISYEQMLEIFWKIHDPTTLNQQGFDFGSQYRSAVFYHNEEQKRLAEKTKPDKAVTEIVPAEFFWPAEDYHQKYFKKQGHI